MGARFKTTTLSSEFHYEDFVRQYGNGATLLCVVNEDDSVVFDTVDKPLVPKQGQRIITLVGSIPIPSDHAALGNTSGEADEEITS